MVTGRLELHCSLGGACSRPVVMPSTLVAVSVNEGGVCAGSTGAHSCGSAVVLSLRRPQAQPVATNEGIQMTRRSNTLSCGRMNVRLQDAMGSCAEYACLHTGLLGISGCQWAEVREHAQQRRWGGSGWWGREGRHGRQTRSSAG